MHYIFVLPVKNEENSIAEVINSIKLKFNFNDKLSFIVVSDSSDQTDEIVSKLENVKLIQGLNFGLGYSVYKGIKEAVKLKPDYIFTVDTDGQVDLNEITIFVEESKTDKKTDILLSSRFLQKNLIEYDYPAINKFGTIILKGIINLFTNIKVTDSHGGIRMFKNKVGEKLKILGDHTYVQEFLIDASQNNFIAREIPSKWLKRKHGKSKVVGSILKYIVNVGPVLFVRLNFHKKIFYGLGFLMLLYTFYSLIYYQEKFLLNLSFSILLFICGYILEVFKSLIFYIKTER